MEAAVAPLAAIFRLNSDLLLNCLDDLSAEVAQPRPCDEENHILFLAAHLTDTRHFLAAQLGNPGANPLDRYLAEARGIDDIRSWPSLEELREVWTAISSHLGNALDSLSSAAASRPSSSGLSVDGTLLGLIAFLAQHDSYHLGQVALLRRQVGKPAMSYTRDTTPG